MKPLAAKIPLLLVVWLFPVLTSSGQNISYSNLSDNLFARNPASISNYPHLNILGYYRNQWPGTSDFVSYSASVFQHFGTYNSTLGFHTLRDAQGGNTITTTQLALFYSYRLRIARAWQLSAGLHLDYSIYTTNFGTLRFERNALPANITDENIRNIGFSTGFELMHQEHSWYGVSIENPISFPQLGNPIFEPALNLHYRTQIPLQGSYQAVQNSLEPLFHARVTPASILLLYGSRIDLNKFLGGLYLRQDIRFHFDALIILLGTRIGNTAVFYTYDINLSNAGSQFTSLAAHEVTFSHRLEYNRKSKKKGAIKCPKI